MRGQNYKFTLRTLGFMLIIESLFMLVCTLVSIYHHEEIGDTLLACCAITLIVGIPLALIGYEKETQRVSKRESFLTVTLVWTVMPLLGMLPFYLTGTIESINDAFFEAMSAFSTTGANIIPNLDEMPKGLLLWRCLMQWMGGIGIIAFALLLLPMVGDRGMALYSSEVTGIGQNKFSPKVKEMVRKLWLIYMFITVILFVLLAIGPMSSFDALCHAFSTVSTGGNSTKQMSIAYWNSAYIEYVICVFMFIGGTNFTLLYFLFKGRWQKIVGNEEFKWYIAIILIFTAIIVIGLSYTHQAHGVEKTFRVALFQVVSFITSTGFTTADFNVWGVPFVFLVCLLTLFCACAGSTSGGFKIVRVVVLAKNAVNEFKRQVHPNAVLPVRIDGTVLPIEVVTKVLAFVFLYLMILGISFFILSLLGMSFEESIGAALACLSNVGPSIGELGPMGGFSELPTACKWYLTLLMLIGRLELFTVLSLFMPAFWRK